MNIISKCTCGHSKDEHSRSHPGLKGLLNEVLSEPTDNACRRCMCLTYERPAKNKSMTEFYHDYYYIFIDKTPAKPEVRFFGDKPSDYFPQNVILELVGEAASQAEVEVKINEISKNSSYGTKYKFVVMAPIATAETEVKIITKKVNRHPAATR